MTMVPLRASAASREDLRTWRYAVLLAASMVCAACGDDEGAVVLPGNSGPTPAGSCNFMAEARCDEYSEVDATSATAGSCTSAGGVWSAGKCPFKARTGVCSTPASNSTRTYSYSAEAADALKASCMNFIEIKSMAGRGGTTSGGYAGAGTTGGRAGAGAGGGGAGGSGAGGAGGQGGGGGAAGSSGAGGGGGSAGATGGSGGNGGGGGAAGGA